MTYLDVLGKALSSPAIASGNGGGEARAAAPDARPAEASGPRPGLLRRLFRRRARAARRPPERG